MQRSVQPEILDSLPPEDPLARRSRRDLRRINAIMGNFRWILQQCRHPQLPPSAPIIELGAGDGHLIQRLAQHFPERQCHAVDFMPAPATLSGVHWHQGDLFQIAPKLPGAIIVANLFLHHFEKDALHRIGQHFATAAAWVINEPERRLLHCWQGKLAAPFLSRLTRHDLDISVRAGFHLTELRDWLGLHSNRWIYFQESHWLGAHRVLAWRDS